MELQYDVISQFAKVINKDKKQSSETTVYGTIKVDGNGNKYVQLDGSDQLTPLTDTDQAIDFMTATAKEGHRVTVLIKNHTATVTGNLTKPAASTDDIESFNAVVVDQVNANYAYIQKLQTDKADVNDLDAANARIDTLESTIIFTKDLEAVNAEITNLKSVKMDADVANATFATIEKLNATDTKINNLEVNHAEFESATTDSLSAINATIKNANLDNLNATYASIDFSNIDKAAMEYFYSQSGLIENVTVGDQTITGNLVGVTISGDLIEGNTIKAEKLVIKGTDGIYYKLNTDGIKVEAQQTDYNSINGQVIKAKSITATKINVDDLVAFDATIGGFIITDNSLYSGVKESVNNTTRGIYLDKDGQMAIGDSNNFMKYYRDTDGSYKLELAVKSLSIEGGIGGRNLLNGTKDFSGFYSNRTTTTIVTGADGFSYVDFPVVSSLDYRAISSTRSMIPIEDVHGREITFSFEIRSDTAWSSTGTNINIGFALCNDTSTNRIKYQSIYYIGDIGTDWVRVSAKTIVDENHLTNGSGNINECTRFYVQVYNYSLNHLQVRKPKVEYGCVATDWTPSVNDVDVVINNASKTATDFLEYDSTNGLQVGNKSGGSWKGFRTQITNSAFRILNATGAVLASYGEKLIELGKNATDAVIKFCGGKGQIEYDTLDESLQLTGDNVRLKGNTIASVYSKHYDGANTARASSVNVSPDRVDMFSQRSTDIDPDTHVGTYKTSELTVDPDGINELADDITETSRNSSTYQSVLGDINVLAENGKVNLSANVTVGGKNLIDLIYPIGSIYMSVTYFDPATIFGGTWERLMDRFLLGSGAIYGSGHTGGESTHTLTVSEMPKHQHSVGYGNTGGYVTLNSNNTKGSYLLPWTADKGYSAADIVALEAGGGYAHNNMPPYLVVNMWKRIA